MYSKLLTKIIWSYILTIRCVLKIDVFLQEGLTANIQLGVLHKLIYACFHCFLKVVLCNEGLENVYLCKK